ncbi:hypothetical protein MUG91_G42n220 [Manis pentadactyla]|nr:hypothetical protein MUG91_G42n220 [Manis pentadactyla]
MPQLQHKRRNFAKKLAETVSDAQEHALSRGQLSSREGRGETRTQAGLDPSSLDLFDSSDDAPAPRWVCCKTGLLLHQLVPVQTGACSLHA